MQDSAPLTIRPSLPAAPGRRAMAWAGALIFLTTGYFMNTRPGWNVNSSFSLACAIGERGTFAIDAYHERPDFATEDKAIYHGHVYCDKSPVIAMLGAPVVFLYRRLSSAFGFPFTYAAARWLTTWMVVGVSAAILAVLLAAAFLRRGIAPGRAARAAALWIAATPLLGYSILFFNYVPACAMAFGGMTLVEDAWLDGRRPGAWRLGAGGFLMGLAAWTLNTMAIAALVLTGALMFGTGGIDGRGERPAARRLWNWAGLWPWVLGGLLGVCGYFIYVHAIFGSLTSPYAYEADPFFREQMAHGFMGAGRPRPLVAWLITFHPFFGLFCWFPLTLAAMGGLLWTAIRGLRSQRIESVASIAIFLALLGYNSGYFMWWGGWAYAPRHLIPALPFLALGLAPWLAGRRRGPSRVLLAIGLFGALFNVFAVAVDPQIPPGLPQEALMAPEQVRVWPTLAARVQSLYLRHGLDDNWVEKMGLRGLVTLIPLVLLWIVAWWRIGLIDRGSTSGSNPPEAPRAPQSTAHPTASEIRS